MTGPPARGFAESTEPIHRGAVAPPIAAVVRVLDGSGSPQRVRLEVGTCTVGSAPGCDLVVAAPTVSRTHVELGLVPEGVSVRDLGSRNGTFFGGQRVERMVVALGSRLRIGSVTLAIEADAESLAEVGESPKTSYRGIVGVSPAMRRLFATLARLEGSLATVLVEGESGAGKERVAQALHDGSAVCGGQLVVLNCGAVPRELIASELFGHRKGAFSGAFDHRRGAFESADRGTLFLDEIGELPLDVQPMLLRAIELGEVRALGDDVSKRVKVRIVAATNRDLEAEVRAGRFRQDLFYRLAVVRLQVPPLSARVEDIEPLALRFAANAGLPGLDREILDELRSRTWPGNARELQNAVLSYAALGQLPEVRSRQAAGMEQAMVPFVDVARPYADQKDEITEAFTRAYLQALMARARGNQSEAARLSGINRTHLGRMLAKHGLLRGGARDEDDDA